MIAKVEHLYDCTLRGCTGSLIKVTFDSGRTTIVHDDGSLIAWTGEQQ